METAIVLGTFDGLHKGHRAVIEKASGFYTVAVTFDVPPKAFFGGNSRLLMTVSAKAEGLKLLGVNEILTLDFSKVFKMSAHEFFCFLKDKYSPALISCGYNYRFGSGAQGDINMLSSLCEQNGIAFRCADTIIDEGTPVSSSALRGMVESGNVSEANRQIYGGFGFSSDVIHGDSRGKTFGFPTINQKFPDELVKPLFGVYKTNTIIRGKEYESVTNIGIRPTFRTDFVGCETFIKNFDADIYGETVTLKFVEFIRKEEKFSTAEALKAAVKADIESVLGIKIK